jgi:phosphatidate phosphatase PAH1
VLGRHFEVSLSLGTGELGDDIRMEEAIVSVSKSKTILTTQLVGMKGTVKECISDGDYELTITVGLVATDANGMVTDEYPSEGVKALRDLLERNEVLYVNSEFLRLFEITRLVVKKYKIEQATHGNHQIVKIEEALSDGDYIIENNKY